MASLTQWTWVWANSRSWWWTGKPGVLQPMGSQRVRHDWATELTDWQCSTGNSTQYLIITYSGKESEKEYVYDNCICHMTICIWICIWHLKLTQLCKSTIFHLENQIIFYLLRFKNSFCILATVLYQTSDFQIFSLSPLLVFQFLTSVFWSSTIF